MSTLESHLRVPVLSVLLLLPSAFYCLSDGPVEALQWTDASVNHLHIALEDPTRVEDLIFGPNGIVLASEGTKNGPISGPAYHWKIEQEGLHIFGEDGVSYFLILIRQTPSEIVALKRIGKNSEVEKFKVVTK